MDKKELNVLLELIKNLKRIQYKRSGYDTYGKIKLIYDNRRPLKPCDVWKN